MSNTNIVLFLQDAVRGMKAYGPRSLIEMDHTNIITGSLSLIRSFFRKAHITVVSNFDPSKIKTNSYKSISFVRGSDLRETIVSVGQDSNHVVIFNNDVAFNDYLLHTTPKDHSALIFDNRPVDRNELCGLTQHGKVIRIAYGLDDKNKNAHMFSNIYVLHGKELIRACEILADPKYQKFALYEIINLLIDEGYEFNVATSKKSKSLVITHPSDITKVARFYK